MMRHRRVMREPVAMLLVLVPAALAGCSRDATTDALFPLAAGHRWTYRVATQWSDGKIDEDVLTMTSLGEEALPAGPPGAEQGMAWRRHSNDGVDYWLRADASGLRRVAARSLFDAQPRQDAPSRYVLKAPYAVGTQWQASTTAYMLERKFDFPKEVRHAYAPVPMTYRIEAVDDSADTPAGRYNGCLRVRGTASIRVYADPVGGWREVPLTTLEWYCRGVGLVRVERSEPVPSPFMAGGTRVLALQSFR